LATWIKTGEKVGQTDTERSEQNAKRKQELANERAEVARREELMAKVLKSIHKNNLGVVRTIVESLSWNMNKDKERSHCRVLWLAGELGGMAEDRAKDVDLQVTLEDLTRDGGGERLARLLVLWHCREEFYNHYGEPKLLNALAEVLENVEAPEVKAEPTPEEQEVNIPATEIAARVKKAKGKAKKSVRKRGKKGKGGK
jgi:hypothetical protein